MKLTGRWYYLLRLTEKDREGGHEWFVAGQNGPLIENNWRITDLLHELSDVRAYSVHNKEVRCAKGFVIKMQYLYDLQPSLTWQTSWMHCMVLTINSFLTLLSFLPSYLDFNFIIALSFSLFPSLSPPPPLTVSSSESHTEPSTVAFFMFEWLCIFGK